MAEFARDVLDRLPLADGVMSMLSYVAEPEFLDRVFEEHRGRAYEWDLEFSTLVHLIGDALLEHEGSAHQAFRRAREAGTLSVTIEAAYGKLRRIPLAVSHAFLAQTGDRLGELLPQPNRAIVPASLRGMELMAVDGKKIKNVAKRLKPARAYSGTPLGGKVVAALAIPSNLIVAINTHPDGETNDGPLVPGLLPQVRCRVERPILWIADRQFCDLTQTHLFLEEGHHFLVRYHPKNHFHADPSRPARCGTDSQGRRYREEWGHLGSPKNKKRIVVRRITLFRPDDEDVILVTDLLDADRFPAADLMDAYLLRWGIECVFQQVTEVFHLQHLIGSSPQATIFQFAFCALLYNLIQVVREIIAEAQRRPTETISSELLFYDIHRELIALSVLTKRDEIIAAYCAPRTAAEVRALLQQSLATTWSNLWIKSPKKKPSKAPAKQTIHVAGGHTSIYRILLQERQKTKPKKKRKSRRCSKQ